MELLPTTPYSGPPPRYAVGAIVYYRGLAYTVGRVCGRAPLVGWTYAIDGPGELLQVGEGEISDRPQAAQTAAQRWYAQTFAGMRQSLYGAWLSADPAFVAAVQQLADEERAVYQIVALSGQPAAVCQAALADYPYGTADLITRLKWGTVQITADGDVIATNYHPFDSRPPILAFTEPRPTPRLSRRERRAKHRPWTPPTK